MGFTLLFIKIISKYILVKLELCEIKYNFLIKYIYLNNFGLMKNKEHKKLVFISDTHSFHRRFDIPEGDFIIHCGDISGMSKVEELVDFTDWFSSLPHKYKILIPGNHDLIFEDNCDRAREITDAENIIVLIEQGIELEGIKFWGSPITPFFCNWAFNRFRGPLIEKHWDNIPNDTDVLITHGPPSGILDKCSNREKVGCEDLLNRIKLVKPKYHAFGHIHHSYGIYKGKDTTFINASLLNDDYIITNKPIVIEYDFSI